MSESETITIIFEDIHYTFLHRIKIGQSFLKADFFEQMTDGSLKILYSYCWNEEEYNALDSKRKIPIKRLMLIE